MLAASSGFRSWSSRSTPLGWSSQLGLSFFSEAVVDCAHVKLRRDDTDRLLHACIDPRVILTRAREDLCEFRAKAFYDIARKF